MVVATTSYWFTVSTAVRLSRGGRGGGHVGTQQQGLWINSLLSRQKSREMVLAVF